MIGNENPCNRDCVGFHGYKVFRCGKVLGKSGKDLKVEFRERRNSEKLDACVRLYYRGKSRKWTLHRLIAACFLGPIDGYEINHKDRNTLNNHVDNLERVTPSQNQRHWRRCENEK